MSRTSKSAINSIVGIGCSIISSLLSFVLQAVFIRLLGLEYGGINSLFGSILNMLNIAELGISNAILFRLYGTIARGETDQTEKLLSAYRKICYLVAGIISVVGLCCTPFLGYLVKEKPTFPESLWSLYIIVLASSVVSHVFDYAGILIVAKQDRYISTIIQYGSLFLTHGLQIFVLWAFQNIYLYLLVKLFTLLLRSGVMALVCKKRYGMKWHSKLRLEQEEKLALTKDVGSLAAYKFCRTLDANIDTFLISKYVAVATTSIYGSTSMLLSALNELLGQFNDGMSAGVGDLYARGDKQRVQQVFLESYHFTFLMYGTCCAVLAPFIGAFTQWWIGYTLSDIELYVMLLNFFMYGMGMNVATFRNAMGIFVKGWKRPAFTAFFNLVFSVLLVQRLGLLGTLLGTVIARTLTLTWYDPLIVFKYGMNQKPWIYYFRYAVYLTITAVASGLMIMFSQKLPAMNNFISLLWHGIVFTLVALAIVGMTGAFFPEQKRTLVRIENMLLGIVIKLKRH